MRLRALSSCLIALIVTIAACNAPPVPPEVEKAENQSLELRRAGAPVYFPQEYAEYSQLTTEAKDAFFKTKAKFVWFRKYEKTASNFRSLLERGDSLLKRIEALKKTEIESAEARVRLLKSRIENIRKVGLLIRDGRVARTFLVKAELLAVEGESLIRKGEYKNGKDKLSRAEFFSNESANSLMSVLERYNDGKLLTAWQDWVEETVLLSRKEGVPAIVISKIDQTLTLYKNGRSVRTFAVSIGRDGLFDKKHAGDYATPEGRYRITKKNPDSQYHKALLIDYPNASDRQDYGRNQQKGLIPSGVGIGGRIEIHGGGSDVVTDGCIGMTDREIELLYELVNVGTPVTIIGSKRSLKSILEEGNGN